MRIVPRIPITSFVPVTIAGLFSAQRNLFSSTGIKYPCRDGGPDRFDEIEEMNSLREKSADLEKNLCVARSVMARMNVLLQEAHRSGKLQIPVELAKAITVQMHEQRLHKLEDHECEIRKAKEALAEVRQEKQEAKSMRKRSDSAVDTLGKREAELIEILHKLKQVNTRSNAFLDRDQDVVVSPNPELGVGAPGR